MECIINKSCGKPFLYSKNNIITAVDRNFINLMGYTPKEFIGKTLSEISCILKMDSQINIENIEDVFNCYIFTKKLEPMEVNIYCQNLKYNNERIYFLERDLDSSIKEKFDFVKQLYTDSKSGLAIISVPDCILLKANDNYLYSLDELDTRSLNCIGKKLNEVITGYEGSEAEKIWKSVITVGKPYHVEEFQYDYFKRGVTYWNSSIVPIFVDGKLKYIINTILDVTEKVLNKNLINEKNRIIKEQKEELAVIVENMSDKVVFIDENGKSTITSRMAKDDSLYNVITMSNNPIDFKKYKYLDENRNLISYENMPVQRVIRGEKVSRYLLITENKNTTTYILVTGTPKYDKTGKIIGGVMIYRDMTEKIKNQESMFLKTQYKALETIIKNLDLGCTITSYPDLNIRYINNKSFGILKKINPEVNLIDIIGKNALSIYKYDIYENIKLEMSLKELTEKRSSSYFFYKKYIDEGEEKFFKIMCQPILGINNNIHEVIFIQFDITEEICAKNKMAETLKIQDEMFSNISHELKTPLNVIFSTNQLMEMYFKRNTFEKNKNKFARSIDIIKQNCYRFTKIINNIIDISKIESGFLKLNLSNQNIVNIVEDIVQSVSDYIKLKELNIIFDTNTEEKFIACDPYKIERIILNLISNAIKFTNAGGTIFVNLIDKGDVVEISVRDTGIGMDEKYLNNIFKRFHQVDKSLSRNAEGSGIGLSLVKSIVDLHNGKINVESKLDEGSTFKIELPIRIIEHSNMSNETLLTNSKIEMINIEFSDIYSI